MPGAWYESLVKPSWNPPNAVFGPVWTILYVMIAIGGWLLWQHGRPRVAIALWGAQMILNALWSYLFFGLKQPGVAFAEIVVMWLVIGALVIVSWRHSRAASLLFVPYLLWVSFAAVLNFTIWRLNA